MRDDSAGCAPVLAALVIAGICLGLLWLLGAFSSASNNITCKKQQGNQYELCVSGQPHPVYVPYRTWRSARVGGYYDEHSHTVFRTVDDDPAAPHGFGGEDGHGGGEGGHGGGGGE